MSSGDDERLDWVRLLTPKPVTQPERHRNFVLDPSLLPQASNIPEIVPPPLSADEINYLKERCIDDSGETLYDHAIRWVKELPPPPAGRFPSDVVPDLILCSLERTMMKILYGVWQRRDLEARHAEKWIDGRNLEERWQISEDILRGTVLAEMPVYKMIMPRETFEPIEGVSPKGAKPYEKGFSDDPLASSFNWWFHLDHVGFYEILHPQVCGCVADYDSAWITPELLAFVWKVELSKLLAWSRTNGLRPWVLTRQEGLDYASPRLLYIYGFNGCLFKSDDLRAFIKDHPDLCGLKKLNDEDLDKFNAIRWAQTHWGSDPISNKAMAEEIKKMVKRHRPQPYKITTYVDWIKNSNPKRKENQRRHDPNKRHQR